MNWSDWPAKRRPGRACFALAVALGLLAAIAPADPLFTMLGAVILLGATFEGWVPTTYRIEGAELEISTPLSRRSVPLARFRGFRREPGGFWLAGLSTRAALARRRGLWLRCNEDSEAVAQALGNTLEDLDRPAVAAPQLAHPEASDLRAGAEVRA